MSEFWKSLQDKLGKPAVEAAKPLSFREKLELEQSRQREQEKRALAVNRAGMPLKPGESIAEASDEDKRMLSSMLGWKLDIKVDFRTLTTNPAKVDGYWFGVKRYWKFGRSEGEEDELSYKLHFYRKCDHCRALVPTIELGDYLEVKEAGRKMIEDGVEVPVAKSTARLAAYLNDLDKGKADPYCPRMCPSCKKLIKGGTA